MNDLTILLENNYANNEFALQLTAYEKWGCIDFEDACCDLLVSNYLEEAEISDLVYMWNEYCQENNYNDYEFYYNDDDFFNTYFDGAEPMRIIQATQFGDYRYMDNWVTFNGYGNLDSYGDYELRSTILDDKNFIRYELENTDIFEELREEENKEELIKMALELVKEGH